MDGEKVGGGGIVVGAGKKVVGCQGKRTQSEHCARPKGPKGGINEFQWVFILSGR